MSSSRDVILKRRARFVAAALAAAGVVTAAPAGAEEDAGPDADAGDAGFEEADPRPCLTTCAMEPVALDDEAALLGVALTGAVALARRRKKP